MFLQSFSLFGIEERDWTENWPNKIIPGTENLVSVSPDQLEDYAFSVTYALDGGRFGDQLTNYLRALWISWKYDLLFFYRPFEFSDQLVLSDHHILFDQELLKPFSAKLEYFSVFELEKSATVFKYLDKVQNNKNKQLLWNIGLLTPFIEEHFCEKLDDEDFRNFIQALVKPKNSINLVSMPPNCKTIAIHVRTGVGYDWEVNIQKMPTKFPSDTFYLASLKQASEYYKDYPLYVHIFTDHPQPKILQERFSNQFKQWQIENIDAFHCREVGNSHSENILEDMFSMMEFDCLIHPDSSLSRLAAIIVAHELEIKPSHWAEVRRDSLGNLIKDKNDDFIVDPLVIIRSSKGKPIQHMYLAPIPDF